MTLMVAFAATYLEPGNYDTESLRRLVRRPGDREMSAFKEELREAIRNPGRPPGGELLRRVEYDDGSGEAFLQQRPTSPVLGQQGSGSPQAA